MTRWLASGRRPVYPSAPQHGVDEPHQLPGREYECAAMLVARRLAELLSVVGTELRTREPHRVGRHRIVAKLQTWVNTDFVLYSQRAASNA